MSESKRSIRKERTGIVISNKMQKTIVVGIQRQVRHPIYGKFIKKTSRLYVHDELEQAHEGDTVRVAEIRPVSKKKRWRLVEVTERVK